MPDIRVPDRYRLADGAIDTAAIKAHVRIEDVVKLASTKMIGSGDARMAVCPLHEDHKPSLSVTPSLGLFYCHACRIGGDVIDFVRLVSHVPFVEACEWLVGANLTCTPAVREDTLDAGAKRMRNREQASREWRDAMPLAGTVVDAYLASRGVGGNVPGTIRFGLVPRWFDYGAGTEGPRHPAMISACMDVDGRLTGIQRLFLERGGRKSSRGAQRLSLGQIRGGALRLGPEAHTVILCEGVEDCLSLRLMHPQASCWAALGSANLPHVVMPPIVRHVIIGADADAPGIAAADAAREAFQARDLKVDVITPSGGAKDFNEEWMLLNA